MVRNQIGQMEFIIIIRRGGVFMEFLLYWVDIPVSDTWF